MLFSDILYQARNFLRGDGRYLPTSITKNGGESRDDVEQETQKNTQEESRLETFD